MEELRRFVFSVKVIPTLQSKIEKYKKKLKDLLSKDFPDHKEVQALGLDIEFNLEKPYWFIHETKLCYRWYSDGTGVGQCGIGVSRLLCANPSQMTKYYRDDTDHLNCGCQMSWGISVKGNIPSWFEQVKICYNWWPDGRDRWQCGIGVTRLLCAKVGSFTPYYCDDTDWHDGGCRMQWKLVVPKSAPIWMKNTKLCFHWYPDGNDHGQCGDGVERKLCANANKYTPAYRDDTDWRHGGCQMSWGIQF